MSALRSSELLPPAPQCSREEPLFEIVYGQRVELPPMSVLAGRIALRLATNMDGFAEGHGLGTVVMEQLFVLDPKKELKRRPDVAFVSKITWPGDRLLPEEGDWEIVPDLAIEVVSPNDLFAAVIDKKNEYFRIGVKQVWIVIPSSNEVMVYQGANDCQSLALADELDGGQLLPGWRMSLTALFERRPFAQAN